MARGKLKETLHGGRREENADGEEADRAGRAGEDQGCSKGQFSHQLTGIRPSDPEYIKNNAVPHTNLALRACAAFLGRAPLCLRMKDSCIEPSFVNHHSGRVECEPLCAGPC